MIWQSWNNQVCRVINATRCYILRIFIYHLKTDTMKKLFFLFALTALFTACEKDGDDNPIVGENAYILIKPDASFYLKTIYNGLTPEEIVRDAFCLKWTTHWGDFHFFENPTGVERGIPDIYKDYDNNIIKFLSIDIITDNGDLLPTFIKGWDFFILDEAGDTLAYIPNDVIRAAEINITTAYEAGDIDEVYRLFDEAYVYKAFE